MESPSIHKMESITQLFGDLCESHMDEVYKLQPNLTKRPVKNNILMFSFNLRMCGMDSEAERLEELVEHLEKISGKCITELHAVLELMIELSGTGPPQGPPTKRDYFKNNKYVGRKSKYHGYDYYDVNIFEADIGAALAFQECEISSTVQWTLQMMEAAPGTSLPAISSFSLGYPSIDKFEKETRVSLFGALVHSRTTDMEIKLDLPPVPDSADLSGLAIKVPQSIDQSEDEGFQSASNMTPDSQSEPSVTPDIDVWEAVLTYGPSKRRCWERIGCPPGKREEPYLSEAGREAFDKLYKLHERGLQILNNTSLRLPQPVMLSESELVKDVLNALIGVVSTTFSYNQFFQVKQGVYVSGTSPENISSLLTQVGEYGTYYTRLSQFSLQTVFDSSNNKGLVFQAFTSGLRKYLQYYRACVLSTPASLSLLTISFLFRKLGRQLRYLAELCCIGTLGISANRGSSALFPTGVKLLSYLYKEALENGSNENYPILLSLLKTSCEPYTRFIYDWVYSGVFRDVCGEFMIQVNEDFLGFRDKRYWTHGYILVSKEVEDFVPVFLKHLANEIYICGKTINLLKLCCPKHYICWSDIPVPRISITFSLEELKEMKKDCAIYVARMERIARHSSISKEEKDLQTEITKQEFIIQAREAAEKVLETFKDRKLAEKFSLDTKKRELFHKLKDQYEKDKERRVAARKEEADDDYSYAREIRDREKRLKALEEELEIKTRQELIDHYSRLSKEATRKEQRALWKLQRHKLETARLKFFGEEERRMQVMVANVVAAPCEASVSSHTDVGNQKIETTHVLLQDKGFENTIPELESPGNKNNESALRSIMPEDKELAENYTEYNINSGLDAPSYESSTNTPDVDFSDFLPKQHGVKQQVELSVAQSLIDDALKDIGSDLNRDSKSNESTQDTQAESIQVSQGCLKIGENASYTKPTRPQRGVYGHSSDATIKIGEFVPDIRVLNPKPSQYGHSSDSNINISNHMSDVEPGHPRLNFHGHISSGHIKIGEYASDMKSSTPRQNAYGHSSQGNIKIGEYVSDVEPSKPRLNIHGHVSNANIRIGENVSEIASSRPRWNIHGHASQSHIKIGELVSDVELKKPRWSPFGHASHSNIHIGDGTSSVDSNTTHILSEFGHTSNSTVQDLLYGNTDNPDKESTCISKDSKEVQQSHAGATSSSENVIGLSPSDYMEVKKEESPAEDNTDQVSTRLQLSVQKDEIVSEKATSVESLVQPSDTQSPDKEEEKDKDYTWEKEQLYIKNLAEKYCLEKYQDSYDLLSKPPVLQLFSHTMPKQFSFPVDSGIQSALDDTAIQLIELLSLPVLMKYSVTAPMVSHVSLVNKAIVDYFFVELDMEKHFETIRHFLLMEDGEFAQSLSDLLFEKLGSGQTPSQLLSPLVLNSILNKALQYSLHGDTHLASNLAFSLKYLPEIFTPTAPDSLSCLELKYKVDWPLNIVITDVCMNKYSRIFSFLLQLKHMVWTLRDVWFHLKRTALVNKASTSVQYRQLQLYRHEMQHFVKVIQGYIANQILHVTWCEFRNKLRKVTNLEDIYRTHADYLNKALFRGLLTEKAAPLMNIIHSIFSLILKFRIQLISQAWITDTGKQMASHPNFGLMQQSYNTFKYYSDFLFEVVSKLVNRGYQPHLEDFLLRINFNSYYKQS
ncbi:hypothetical protein GDO86_005868 [Hymenochirus boettgeri]|uniref:Gamma-tubulin complex component 6 n=1 Tax=Hymenochirus boettgeri TaxID=247094 RepID=A0A8T2J8V9_9PIPI|nr:hypothetical protein GDO86_005868 [Hymenochirus boettgeri]